MGKEKASNWIKLKDYKFEDIKCIFSNKNRSEFSNITKEYLIGANYLLPFDSNKEFYHSIHHSVRLSERKAHYITLDDNMEDSVKISWDIMEKYQIWSKVFKSCLLSVFYKENKLVKFKIFENMLAIKIGKKEILDCVFNDNKRRVTFDINIINTSINILEIINEAYEITCKLLKTDVDDFKRLIVGGPTKYDVFLSHSWGNLSLNHKLIKVFYDILRLSNIKVWFDEVEMDGPIYFKNGMTEGLEVSKVFVCILEKTFIEKLSDKKSNCRFEFDKAMTDKMKFIFIAATNCDHDLFSAFLEKEYSDIDEKNPKHINFFQPITEVIDSTKLTKQIKDKVNEVE